MVKLVFTTKVYDLETEQYVQGGVRLSVPEDLAEKAEELFRELGKNGYEAERFGVALPDNGLEYDKEEDTILFDSERIKWSYGFSLEKDGEAVSGSTGL